MPDENTPAPSAALPQETQTPATTPTETPGTQNQKQTQAGNPPAATTPEQPKREPWFQRRIDELTAARRATERENEALKAIIASGSPTPGAGNPAGTPPASSPGLQPGSPEFQAEVDRQSQIKVEQQRLNESANRVYQEGKTKHPDFDKSVQQLNQITDLSKKPEFLEVVTRLPNGADLYHHLGSNPDLASEVLSLSGTSLALEMAKLSAEIGKPPKTSAPPPTTNVGSGSPAGGSDELSDDLPIDEWMRRREAQLARK